MSPVGEWRLPDVIHLMENHDRAYELWSEGGMHQRTLVHIDAHHDMVWAEDRAGLSIANYICFALKEQIVREVYWVVPDHTWTTWAGRAAVRAHLEEILSRYPDSGPVRWDGPRLRTAILGRPLAICALDSLPRLDERILLDVDVDYLTIPRVSYGAWDARAPLPWRWPIDVVATLREAGVASDFVTIAYSVNGGYTPLGWKYLGMELACRLRSAPGALALAPYDCMRAGAVAEHEGDFRRAETAWREAGDALGAAPYWRLAHLLVELGRPEDGRRCYEHALALDPSYGAPDAVLGASSVAYPDTGAEERVFNRTLQLDPENAYAHLGLAWIAARGKRWAEAETEARASLALEPDLVDAHRVLGRVLAKQNRLGAAIDAYERSLKLALAGHRPFEGVVATSVSPGGLLDSSHAHVHETLARLYDKAGDGGRAVTGYRLAIAGGRTRPSIRWRLARLYARQLRWHDAWRSAGAGLRSAWRIASARLWQGAAAVRRPAPGGSKRVVKVRPRVG